MGVLPWPRPHTPARLEHGALSGLCRCPVGSNTVALTVLFPCFCSRLSASPRAVRVDGAWRQGLWGDRMLRVEPVMGPAAQESRPICCLCEGAGTSTVCCRNSSHPNPAAP